MNIEKTATAIEADAGQAITNLRKSLQEMQQSKAGRTYTPEKLWKTNADQAEHQIQPVPPHNKP